MKANDDDDEEGDGDGDEENGTAEDQNGGGDVKILTKKQKVGLVLVYLGTAYTESLHAEVCMDLVPSFRQQLPCMLKSPEFVVFTGGTEEGEGESKEGSEEGGEEGAQERGRRH